MSVEDPNFTANLHNNGVVVLEVVKLGEFIVRQTKVYFSRVSTAFPSSSVHPNINNFDIDSMVEFGQVQIELDIVVSIVIRVDCITVMMVPHGIMLIGSLLVVQLTEQS